MPIRNPVQIVDEDLNALRALRKIAQSPAALHTIKRIFSEYFFANAGIDSRAPLNAKEVVTPSRRGAIWDTGIKREIEKILPHLRDRDFDYKNVNDTLERGGITLLQKTCVLLLGPSFANSEAKKN